MTGGPATISVAGIWGTTPAACCGTGTLTLAATATLGILDWNAADAGGTALITAGSFTTPSISGTTTYYVESGCMGALRVPVTAKETPTSVGGSVNGYSTVFTGLNTATLTLGSYTGNVVKWQSSTNEFSDALVNDQERAKYALSMFQQLYAIERRIKEELLTFEAILELSQQEAVPILKQLKNWMTEEYPKVLPKSPIDQAIAYCLPRWDKLSIYATNPILNIDNNPVENAIRAVAIGRKSYLFAGSEEAPQLAAMIYSLFATCRLHNVNPYDWLKDVLERMHLYSTSNIAELLPHVWQKANT